MTELLCLKDSYAKEFTAKIVSVNGSSIVLDKTLFYPSGGGQPADTGKIVFNGSEYNVLNVKKDPAGIIHEADKEGLRADNIVTGSIDWDRRCKLMRSHTAVHVLVSVICGETGALITGNQIGIEKSRIDFNLDSFDRAKIQEYVEKANKLIEQDLQVSIEFTTRDKALRDHSLFKLMKSFPERIKDIRIVAIGSIDRQADGGTHVKSTKEIGRIELLECENKGKNNRRVYFKLRE